LLERFHVPEEDAVRVRESDLRAITERFFEKLGMPAADAKRAADVIITADLCGVETHGVSNMLRLYQEWFNQGIVNPRPDWKVVRETASCANVDCDRGLGLALVPRGMEIAIEKAKATGVGMVTLGNCGHSGMVGYHAMMALEHDMIGVCCSASSGSTVPTFSSEPVMGTNPLAVAAPAGEEAPFVFDAATSAVAGNKVVLAKRMGVNLAPGWVAKPDGTPIMEEAPAPDEFMFLPLGGNRELGSHKGYSLAMIVDILGAVLSGHPAGPMSASVHNQHHYVAAYLIDAFVDIAEFKKDMDEYLRALRSLRPAPGHDRVIYAGLPEAEARADRTTNGIPLHPEVIDWFKAMCGEMEIPFTL